MITYLNSSFYPKGCHRVGTDEGVCPYILVPSSTEQTTRLLVNLPTRQLELIIILNYEL